MGEGQQHDEKVNASLGCMQPEHFPGGFEGDAPGCGHGGQAGGNGNAVDKARKQVAPMFVTHLERTVGSDGGAFGPAAQSGEPHGFR